ncbi:MAG: hypothetical protein ACK40G_06940 [Cytophagaceae bacterium]
MNKDDLKKMKYLLVFFGIVFSVYIYAGVAGWKFFGSNSEKWAPQGEKGHHK